MTGKIFGKFSMIRMKYQMIVAIVFLVLSGCTAYDPEPFAGYPDVKTGAPGLILINSIAMSADVTDDNGLAIKSRGFCWSATIPFPTLDDDTLNVGSGDGAYSCMISGLSGQTNYFIRAFATTNKGTAYGASLSVSTADTTVTDIDNNVYRVVQAGNLLWMAENLRVTRFRNGEAIPEIKDDTEWKTRKTAARCWYQNDEANRPVYGSLYNWFAVNDPRGLAPEGWHVALYHEWQILIAAVGGSQVAGGKLKETGTEHWQSPNTGATDLIGFTALPGGYREGANGIFKSIKASGHWWTSSEAGGGEYWFYRIYNFSTSIDYDLYAPNGGYSVRCVKNNP